MKVEVLDCLGLSSIYNPYIYIYIYVPLMDYNTQGPEEFFFYILDDTQYSIRVTIGAKVIMS